MNINKPTIAESPPPPPIDTTGIKETSVVECLKCHKLHRENSKTYIRVAGDITIGQSGGIVGHSFVRWNGLEILRTVSIFCCDCFIDYIQECIHK